ncbi:hypothetical protein FOZ62_031404, partial [Perkinsus olseni]
MAPTADEALAKAPLPRHSVERSSTVILTAYPYIVIPGSESDILVMTSSEDHTRCQVVAHITDLPAVPACICAKLLGRRLRLGIGCGSTVIILDFNEQATEWKLSHRLPAPDGQVVALTVRARITLSATMETLWLFDANSEQGCRSAFEAEDGETILRVGCDEEGKMAAVLLRCGRSEKLALVNLNSKGPASYTPPFPPGSTVEQVTLNSSPGQSFLYCLATTRRGFTAFKCTPSGRGTRRLSLRPVAYLKSPAGWESRLLLADQKPGIVVALLWNVKCLKILTRSMNTREEDRYGCLEMCTLTKPPSINQRNSGGPENVVPLGVAFEGKQEAPTVLLLRRPPSQNAPPSIVAITVRDR